jgi:hypothetical protein
MDGQKRERSRLGRLLQIAASGALGVILAAVLLSQVGALEPIARALGYGYEGDESPNTVTEVSGSSMAIWASARGNLQARLSARATNVFYSPQFDRGDAGFFVGVVDSGLADPDPLTGPSFDNKVFGPPLLAGDPQDVYWTPDVAQPVTGLGTEASPFTQVTTFRGVLAGTELMQVTQTVSHVNGRTSFDVRYQVKNTSGAPLRFRASAAADLYTEGDDYGTSMFEPGTQRFVGGANDDIGLAAGIVESAATPFDHYQVDEYDLVWSRIDRIGDGGFADTLVDHEVDNAVGVQWDDHVSVALADDATAEFKLGWRFAIPAPLSVDPPTASKKTGDPHSVTVRASDSTGGPYAGRTVRWSITGSNAGSGALVTDGAGRGTIAWPSSRAGSDVLVVFLDLDGDGIRDGVEPQATAGAEFALTPGIPPIVPPPPPPVEKDTTRPNGTLPRKIEVSGRELVREGKLVNKVVVNEPATVHQGLYLDDGSAPRALPARKGRKRATLLGSGKATAKQAGRVKVTIKVNAKGRKAFRRRTVRVVLLTTLVDPAGNRRALAAKRFTVKR